MPTGDRGKIKIKQISGLVMIFKDLGKTWKIGHQKPVTSWREKKFSK